ncbi:vesicle trafficking protein [Aspergillus steynii IBT 23096]|uniref:Vesicle trafficking protein n=1 Tax=Aspergillus steynii IBT 23096 TaxID=1392250 RepID=A0A2I2G812_9EURO|nr:vesicle trafficking protein [Aspergillus steynii IBT 23096]PLB49005.1 vesicle trafficking protein [Aspergillus steynii IBT 23096]
MSSSILNIQHDIILNTIRYTAGDEWKVLVVDETSRKLIDNAVSEDDILNLNVTNVEQIEHRRSPNPGMDALYILSPQTHIVDCLMADFERKRYRKAWLVWTAVLDPQQRVRLERSQMAQDQIASFRVMNADYFPRESRVVTFRDPWSFPVLFHPGCNHLIKGHLESLAQKAVSICVSLGEYPTIRYYRPRTPTHEASVLCSHLARFIQNELDQYAHFQRDFPPPSPRPRGVLLVVDRSMDLIAPLVHEFTYQSMVHDLLPIKDGDKVTYKTIVNEGSQNEEVKEMEISDQDHVWVDYRHLHMKDVLEKLGEDFAKFRAANPQFAEENNKANVNTIKDMLAGLTEFQQGRDAYTLHLNMAQECMKLFQDHKLLEVSSVEQCLSTGLDENYKKAKGLAAQLVQLLDDDTVGHPDRLRLLLLYVIYRGGILGGDIRKLMAHGQLPPQDGEVIYNLDLLGARAEKPLKDEKPPVQPLFNRKPPSPAEADETSLTRYELNVKLMLEDLVRGTLDSTVFPFTRPQTDADGMGQQQDGLSQASLRSAKPTWARTRSAAEQPKQRIIVFMAGGATYGETRTCYEVSQAFGKDVFMATSHMLSPSLFLRQLGDLSTDRRRLDIPAERPKPTAPAHLFEREPPPPQPAPKKPPPMPNLNPPVPPSQAMGAMSLGPNAPKPANGTAAAGSPAPGGKPPKEKKEKKRHHFFR